MDINQLIGLEQQQKYKELSKILEEAEGAIAQKVDQLYDAFKKFDWSQISLIILYILYHKPIESCYLAIDKYFYTFNPEHLQFSQEKLSKLAEKYLSFLGTNKILIKGLKSIYATISKLTQQGNQFTHLHILYVQACIKTRNYKAALKLINQPIVQINNDAEELEILSYYYFAGLCFLALKYFDKAEESFQLLINLVDRVNSNVQVEAKKKLIILQLRKGQISDSLQVNDDQFMDIKDFDQSILNELTSKYRDLISNKNVQKPLEIDQIIAQHKETFQKDQNLGLILQFKVGVIIKKLKQLKKIYKRYPLKNLFKECFINEVDINALQNDINKVKQYFKINRKLNCIDFIQQDEIDHQDLILKPLAEQVDLLKNVKQQYENLNENIILEKLNLEQFNEM